MSSFVRLWYWKEREIIPAISRLANGIYHRKRKIICTAENLISFDYAGTIAFPRCKTFCVRQGSFCKKTRTNIQGLKKNLTTASSLLSAMPILWIVPLNAKNVFAPHRTCNLENHFLCQMLQDGSRMAGLSRFV